MNVQTPVSIAHSNGDKSTYKLENTVSTATSVSSNQGRYSNEDSTSTTTSNYSNLPRNSDWEVLNRESQKLRTEETVKAIEMNNQYGHYVDTEPAFLSKKRKIAVPKCITGIERVKLEADLRHIVYDESKAIRQAQIYRDKCATLERCCEDLKKETQAVRYFWRNQLMEGQSRSAKILGNALGLQY